MMKLKRINFKKINQANTYEPSEPEIISQTHNPLNLRLELNEEVEFPTKLLLTSQSISNKK